MLLPFQKRILPAVALQLRILRVKAPEIHSRHRHHRLFIQCNLYSTTKDARTGDAADAAAAAGAAPGTRNKLDFHKEGPGPGAGSNPTSPKSKAGTTTSRVITTDYQHIRSSYATPRYPVMLCHGLCGFDTVKLPILGLASSVIPPFSYWHGIKEALEANNIDVYTTAVPPTASIEDRARGLFRAIVEKVPVSESDGLKHVNLVGHSMGGLDARYVISKLVPEYNEKIERGSAAKGRGSENENGLSNSTSTSSTDVGSENKPELDVDPEKKPDDLDSELESKASSQTVNDTLSHTPIPAAIKIESLTTIASPHRGSHIADLLIHSALGPDHFPSLYSLIPSLGFKDNNSKGFNQLTTEFMEGTFNKTILDDPHVAYFSYGARARPHYFNVFRKAWKMLKAVEGENDGLVSVKSAKWGEYIGTIDGVDHLDLVNFTNLVQYNLARLVGRPRPFNAIALYLHITDMLAKKGF